MRDKDSQLIWEAYSPFNIPPEFRSDSADKYVRWGVLMHEDMYWIEVTVHRYQGLLRPNRPKHLRSSGSWGSTRVFHGVEGSQLFTHEEAAKHHDELSKLIGKKPQEQRYGTFGTASKSKIQSVDIIEGPVKGQQVAVYQPPSHAKRGYAEIDWETDRRGGINVSNDWLDKYVSFEDIDLSKANIKAI